VPVVMVCLVLASAGACEGSGLGGEPIVIGVSVPLSGDNQAEGEAMVRALEMARDRILAEGGIDGPSSFTCRRRMRCRASDIS
jgi:ABC-type branched-subunit amino acid transport system substrate-binding protein